MYNEKIIWMFVLTQMNVQAEVWLIERGEPQDFWKPNMQGGSGFDCGHLLMWLCQNLVYAEVILDVDIQHTHLSLIFLWHQIIKLHGIHPPTPQLQMITIWC